jgi:hypothetical protein
MESWLNNETTIDNFTNNDNLNLEEDLNLNTDNINIEWEKLKGKNNNNIEVKYRTTIINNILKFQINLNKSNNLNKFLDSKIIIHSDEWQKYYCSIRFLVLLTEKIYNLKITKNDKYHIIPIVLFINIYHIKSDIAIFIYPNSIYKYNLQILSNTIKEISNKFITLETFRDISTINDCIQRSCLQLNRYTMGVIIWYKSDIDFLEPTILKVEITFYNNNIKFSKDIDIEKIKFNDKIGYFISTNKLNFNQIFNFYKNFNSEKDIENYLISWEKTRAKLIEIHWTSYHDNSFCVVENLNFKF